MISAGAVVENIVMAAMEQNLKPEAEYFLVEGCYPCVAKVSLKREKCTKPVLAGYLWKRNTNRKRYSRSPLSEEVLKDLKKSISDFPDVNIHFVSEKNRLKKVGSLVYKADLLRNRIRSIHEHLHGKIRYTVKDAEDKRDGFPVKNLEAGFLGEMVLSATRKWEVMNLANKAGLDRMISMISSGGITNSGSAALITVRDYDYKSFIKGGRAMERIWLELTRKGISFQPMTAVTLFLNRLKWEGDKNFMEGHRKILEDIVKDYGQIFPEADYKIHGQIMLFRMGYSKPVEVNTLRKNFSDFLI